uniref:Uncharacterized protein n=1 Tax=Anguilla anguilla TaxID=7936 RepID=A0A0E9TEK9_ANGAN
MPGRKHLHFFQTSQP